MFSEGERQRLQDMLDAVVRKVEIIGEASKHVPERLTRYYTDADGSRIGAMQGPPTEALEKMISEIDKS